MSQNLIYLALIFTSNSLSLPNLLSTSSFNILSIPNVTQTFDTMLHFPSCCNNGSLMAYVLLLLLPLCVWLVQALTCLLHHETLMLAFSNTSLPHLHYFKSLYSNLNEFFRCFSRFKRQSDKISILLSGETLFKTRLSSLWPWKTVVVREQRFLNIDVSRAVQYYLYHDTFNIAYLRAGISVLPSFFF